MSYGRLAILIHAASGGVGPNSDDFSLAVHSSGQGLRGATSRAVLGSTGVGKKTLPTLWHGIFRHRICSPMLYFPLSKYYKRYQQGF